MLTTTRYIIYMQVRRDRKVRESGICMWTIRLVIGRPRNIRLH